MAAAKTGRIRLGTSVTNLPFHHPFQVAERIAFLDHLSYGRAILGIGPSSLVTDKKLFKIDSGKARRMMSEAADVIVRLLEADDPISHKGEFWQFDDMRLQLKSYQQPRLPLALPTTGGLESLDLAARHDMELWTPLVSIAQAEACLRRCGQILKKRADAKARPPIVTAGIWLVVFISQRAEREAWADVREGLMRETGYFLSIGFKSLYQAYPDQPISEITAVSAAERRDWVIGTPDDAIAWIENKIEQNGQFGGVMLTTHEWAGSEKLKHSLELFARYVIPHFNSGRYNLKNEAEVLAEQFAEHGEVLFDAEYQKSNLANK